MNRFEGLNLVDLLALLHEIVPPERVSLAPQTPGWWIALAWLLTTIACIAAAVLRRRRQNRYRREALAELKRIEMRATTPEASAELAALLKRTALAAYPRRQVASLYGDEWARFLAESTEGDAKVSAAAEALARAAYRDDIELADMAPAAERWIRRHRV